MTTSKNRLFLLGSLLIAVSLVSVGAGSASAAVWKMGGTNVSTFFELPMSGGETFEITSGGVGVGGMNCEIKATMTSSGGSTAKITKWETKSCVGFGTMETCTMKLSEAKFLPWTVTVNATNLTTLSHRVRRTFSNCSTAEFDKVINPMTFTPDNAAAIKVFEFQGVNGTYDAFGSLSIEGANSGTFGIG